VRQGKALYVGISRWPLEALKVAREYLAAHDVPMLIYQGRLNLIDRAPMEEGILEYCHKHCIGFISFSPLASGKLRDQYAEALNWILEQQGVTSVLVGVSKTEQVKKNLEALNLV
jgi:L-glyceraldehyde 3-phosphate reductase